VLELVSGAELDGVVLGDGLVGVHAGGVRCPGPVEPCVAVPAPSTAAIGAEEPSCALLLAAVDRAGVTAALCGTLAVGGGASQAVKPWPITCNYASGEAP
jgi:hypothetical protein